MGGSVMYQRRNARCHDLYSKYWVSFFSKKFNIFLLLFLTVLSCITAENKANGATMIANSVEDFSSQQGQDDWYYGFDNGSGFQPNVSEQSVQATDSIATQWGKLNKDGGYFSGENTPDWVIRRWQSDFNGVVNIGATIQEKLGNQSAMDLHMKIFVDDVNILSEDREGDAGASQYDVNVDVNVGSTIDFAFTPDNKSWQGGFDFTAEITTPSGLVFRESDNGKGKEVGLFFNNQVYEANQEYQEGSYWDHLTKNYQDIAADKGVQDQHTLGSFLHNSTEQYSSPVDSHEHIELDWEIAEKMADLIKGRLDSGYEDEDDPNIFTTPYTQKGGRGNFGNAGLIEWAAEKADVNGGQGFIPKHFESIIINNFLTLEHISAGFLSERISSLGYTTADTGTNNGQNAVPNKPKDKNENSGKSDKNFYPNCFYEPDEFIYLLPSSFDNRVAYPDLSYANPESLEDWLIKNQYNYDYIWPQGLLVLDHNLTQEDIEKYFPGGLIKIPYPNQNCSYDISTFWQELADVGGAGGGAGVESFNNLYSITPRRLNYWVEQGQDNYADSYFKGLFESVEFTLTDPKGRQLGYTKDEGTFNDIPGTFLEEVDEKIQFIIPNREFDDYKIDIFGITEKSVGSIIKIKDKKSPPEQAISPLSPSPSVCPFSNDNLACNTIINDPNQKSDLQVKASVPEPKNTTLFIFFIVIGFINRKKLKPKTSYYSKT